MEPEKANAPRELYSNLKVWVDAEYPTGISEEDWADMLDADGTVDSDKVYMKTLFISQFCAQIVKLREIWYPKTTLGLR